MNSKTVRFALTLSGISLFLSLFAQAIDEDFEALTVTDSIGLETGWSVGAGTAVVSDSESVETSGQSVVLGTTSPASEATRTVQTAEWGSETVAWWDIWVQPVANTEGNGEYSVEVDGSWLEFRATQVLLQQSAVSSYGVGQDVSGVFSASGNSIEMYDNIWKKIPYAYTVTENTVLSFELWVYQEGEIIAIALDENSNEADDKRAFQLSGTETWSNSYQDYFYTGPGFETFTIPVGQFYTGEMAYLAFIGDDDTNEDTYIYFRNIKLYEGTLPSGQQGGLAVNDGSSRVMLPRHFATTSNESDDWINLTLRQDFTTDVWDLFLAAGDVPVAANLGFDGTPTEPTAITFWGHGTSAVYFDNLVLSTTNPIFTDADNDGLEDGWETEMGLNPNSAADRDTDPDSDGYSSLEERMRGTDPTVSDYPGSGTVYYVNNVSGSDTTRNGLSATADVPSAAYGPFATLGKAVTTAATNDTLLIYDRSTNYDETTINLSGKDITLRPVGDVVLR